MELLYLIAGPLTVVFDPEEAFLRYVRLGEVEIVRGVYAAVRDQDWNTVPFTVSDPRLDRSDDHFALSFLAKCSQDDVRFNWRGEITGTEEGVVRFKFSGQALGTFSKSRIGLCVLHPIKECAGRPCRVEHTDGTVTEGGFPKWISPHQPFKDIRSITHTVKPGVEARVTFAGEVFEMEDQRNWSDASFTTYSTPLEFPYPVEIPVGSRVEHTVTIELIRAESAYLLVQSGIVDCHRNLLGSLRGECQAETTGEDNLRTLELVTRVRRRERWSSCHGTEWEKGLAPRLFQREGESRSLPTPRSDHRSPSGRGHGEDKQRIEYTAPGRE